MNKPQNLLEVYYLYQNHIQSTYVDKQAENMLRETRAAIMRPLLVGLGYQEMMGPGKLSTVENKLAEDLLKAQNLEVLITSRQIQLRGLELLQRSKKIKDLYQCKLNQLLGWCQTQTWFPGKLVNFNLSCTESLRGTGHSRRIKLTRRRKNINYTLSFKEISSSLKCEIDMWYEFLTQPEYPGRLVNPIQKSTALQYVKHIKLFLGWFYHYQEISLEQLSLTLLIPKLTKQEISHLSDQKQKKLWRNKQIYLEKWLCEYFKFLREEMLSHSPRTLSSKLKILLSLGKFIYREEIEELDDFPSIPILKTIIKYINNTNQDRNDWQRQRKYIAAQDKKWTDPIPGITVLTIVRERVVEPLRKKCRSRNKNGHLRQALGIAMALQKYLAWSFLADMPARRQDEYRNLKISLTCPIKKPKEVPIDGLYHPLLPDEKREKRYDNSIEDNYIYKTYVHQGKFYEHGIWVLDIQSHKNWKVYGAQSIIIPNPKFDDKTCLYEYIESYLYGQWRIGGRKHQVIYDWWQPELLGCRGSWATSGRAEFMPADFCCIQKHQDSELWSWGYFFVQPYSGKYFCGTRFSAMISDSSCQLIGKSISPHTMRSIWATWAYQIELSDQQKESLAYAMGHTLKTLKSIYDRSTPEEKRRPIEEAINQHLFNDFMLEASTKTQPKLTADLAVLMAKLEQLTLEERNSLRQMLLNPK